MSADPVALVAGGRPETPRPVSDEDRAELAGEQEVATAHAEWVAEKFEPIHPIESLELIVAKLAIQLETAGRRAGIGRHGSYANINTLWGKQLFAYLAIELPVYSTKAAREQLAQTFLKLAAALEGGGK